MKGAEMDSPLQTEDCVESGLGTLEALPGWSCAAPYLFTTYHIAECLMLGGIKWPILIYQASVQFAALAACCS
eukprot:1041241-Pelagomonas_calceolata.AAC.1